MNRVQEVTSLVLAGGLFGPFRAAGYYSCIGSRFSIGSPYKRKGEGRLEKGGWRLELNSKKKMEHVQL